MKILIAKSFKDRLLGLMFKKSIDYGMLFYNCKSVHTFFMNFNIDIILLDNQNKVLDIRKDVKPNKVIIFNNKKRTSILELPSNSSINININDIIDLNNL